MTTRSRPPSSSRRTPSSRRDPDTPEPPFLSPPAAYLLYNKVMNVDPADPRWIGRDRFILSAGHSSLTQYVQLYLTGFGLEVVGFEEAENNLA